MVLHVALATPCKKVTGIELSETRHMHGVEALKEATKLSERKQATFSLMYLLK